jgi:hypothetical protein
MPCFIQPSTKQGNLAVMKIKPKIDTRMVETTIDSGTRRDELPPYSTGRTTNLFDKRHLLLIDGWRQSFTLHCPETDFPAITKCDKKQAPILRTQVKISSADEVLPKRLRLIVGAKGAIRLSIEKRFREIRGWFSRTE